MTTVRVRVKVLLNAEGKWAAYGWTADEDDVNGVLYDMMGDNETESARAFYLIADLDLPQPTEIAAEVQSESAS